MNPTGPDAPLPSALPGAPKKYEVGTLTYTQQGVAILFFWLMWNEFSLMLIEKVGFFTNFLMRDHGATYTEIAIIGTVGGWFALFINPVLSTWSDRLRTPWGRRRPILLVVAPIFACCLMLTPFMPDFYYYVVKFPAGVWVMSHIPMNGVVLFLAVIAILTAMSNQMVLTIFSYLYWDVVPKILFGRFSGMTNIAIALAGVLWNFYLIGFGDHHMKGVYVGVSVACLAIYFTSVLVVKEGGYPPPDVRKKGGGLAPIRAYLVECFSEPYYLWIFGGFTLLQIGNLANDYQGYYLRYDLHLSYSNMGIAGGIPDIMAVFLGFGIGWAVDLLKPVRLMAPAYLFWALTNVGAFIFVHDMWSYAFWSCVTRLATLVIGILLGAFTAEMYPREKLGQFCSASATSQSLVCNLVRPLVGMLFDFIHFNRFCYLFSAFFEFLGALVFLKVYYNWEKRKERSPVPHAG